MAKKSAKNEPAKGPATIQNRRATFDYHVEDTLETGIELRGSEVKSLFLGRANLTDSYCRVKNDELWVYQMDIEPYAYAHHFLPERRRDRKLLAKRKEISVLERKSLEKGLSLVPLKVYFNDRGRAKLLLGLCRGKKDYDKRTAIAERETKRETARVQRGDYRD
ncbi:MAG: SsrA-binding protein SmpB [Armatimonadetes bacterium]|nr:SsrA-binding protein SmpB [Armatimonadota bacterium]